MKESFAAGIHIGTVSASIVLVDDKNKIIYKDYLFHNGNISAALEEMLKKLSIDSLDSFAVVAEKGRGYFTSGTEVNEQVAIIEGVKYFFPEARSILTIGGENFGIILLDENGIYKKFISNAPCAAGTGSFIDQQASRLNLPSSAELSKLAEDYEGDPPKVATRCAVFAKTDLVHIQQQGYSLSAIAAGICKGVAQNIYDTLFPGNTILDPVVAVGGVSKNKKVVYYLSQVAKRDIRTLPDSEYIEAIGAAFFAKRKKNDNTFQGAIPLTSLLNRTATPESYCYPPLSETKTKVPDFSSWFSKIIDDVEIDIYIPLAKGATIDSYLGIDIGSTSTKIVLMDKKCNIISGLYTYTGGQPIAALQKITSVIEKIERDFAVNFRILASGTTGSGRSKFIQKAARADYSVDEITAHARAAYHLNPEIDTIIEIGGQDSKFSVLKDGQVTFSVMNYSCAAGTGSFIQEQAQRLHVRLSDYAELAVKQASPLINGRCTVFMERDLNSLLSLGYSREELLAAALHAVRDNYLLKVGQLSKLGNCIAFQGATAKNFALVRAFEQKLQKPIYVSKYCHLTGALGVALKLADKGLEGPSLFKKDLHRNNIVVNEYVCEYCKNHCKIKQIDIEGERLGWGYLCGRTEQETFHKKKKLNGFDLLSNHGKVFSVPPVPAKSPVKGEEAAINQPPRDLLRRKIKIGIPSALTMFEYVPLWKLFFENLGFETYVTSADPAKITAGKEIRAAAYCAPITEFHGHIAELTTKADYIFFPQLFANISGKEKKLYCYHSNYVLPVLYNTPGIDLTRKMIAPTLDVDKGNPDQLIHDIYRAFPEKIRNLVSFGQARESFKIAWNWFLEKKKDLHDVFKNQWKRVGDIGVVFLGRPYIVLNPSLNKSIPEKFAEMGVRSFYMDMIPVDEERLKAAKDFIRRNHWHYGNIILKAAEMVAQMDGLFPIYMTAFKCSPDSFMLPYFKEIMNYYGKPYLILQLDEHQDHGGYETRLEAALETFRSFSRVETTISAPAINLKKAFEDKTYLLPAYDPLSAKLLQGAFIHAGIKTILIEETSDTLQKGSSMNDGMCLPLTGLVYGVMNTIEKYNLDPSKTAIICNTDSMFSCNFPQYSTMIKHILGTMGHGMEKVDVMVREFLPKDLPIRLLYEGFMAYIIAALIQRITYKIRPRERIRGATDKVCENAIHDLFDCFSNGISKVKSFQKVLEDFKKIDVHDAILPQVGIIGDIFVRDNDVFNQNLVHEIEMAGAEVVSFPFMVGQKIILNTHHYLQQWSNREYIGLISDKALFNTLNFLMRKFVFLAEEIIPDINFLFKKNITGYLKTYGLSVNHDGETVENLLKTLCFYENYPNMRFIVNVNPMFCCPSLSSETICKKLEKDINIPIISISYDGTKADKNKVLKPYLHFLRH
ncbi:MAG: acyl-CoA dehydratase activase [Elusimicrobia bacterium]|nr:acyl-CoA dehydratase activase [Elusimicrobiota bacterium]